jgi:predicted RNase H-like HicB family nuclease
MKPDFSNNFNPPFISRTNSERHEEETMKPFEKCPVCGGELELKEVEKLLRGGIRMIDLQYSLIIEATAEHDFFGFYSPELPGFSGIGHSVEDCLYKAKWGMLEHVNLLKEQGLPVPPKNPNPKIIIQNEKATIAA